MRLNLPFTVKRPIVFNICALLCLGAALVIGGLLLDTMHADTAVYWGDSSTDTIDNDWLSTAATTTSTITTTASNGSNSRSDSSGVNGDTTTTTGYNR
jgi:hypothetical protein